ncbi:cysteine methyltransferase [Thalassospira marina]|uniref:Cysteine methyltransferase n=2 Tax=Thalassospira marina TaxID=2048283 RepID=A0ABM6Q9P5_9PROT|nr:cysteine methyltransferase [Thalassospira marina]
MTMKTVIDIARYDSPIGKLGLASVDGRLVHLDFEDNDGRMVLIQSRRFKSVDWQENGKVSASVTAWLDGYFAGKHMPLPLADLDLRGTDFQKMVWQALIEIPTGTHVSYAGMATKLGNPKAVRAVARANALNPVSILVPCHRVIGSDGTLTGYAGGLARKQWLLDHEAALVRAA